MYKNSAKLKKRFQNAHFSFKYSDIMRESRGKTAEIEGRLKLQAQGLQDEATAALLNANIEYAKQLGEKKVELAHYIADKKAEIYAKVAEMKDAVFYEGRGFWTKFGS